ncbi:MAG: bifunctional riboflavin kinase/FAD synthetase [Hyphomicrobiaceae bacterium]|nr:bifunctional riboflavin kinase/FAD synthetase [Hyphomicrobiaceae bacterium]
MLVLTDADEVPGSARGGVFAIGNFDGVHRGHKALIARTTQLASGLPNSADGMRASTNGMRASAGVIVFEPHPRRYFRPAEPHFVLTPLDEKLRLLAGLGLDVAVVLTFDAALAGLSAQAFVERVLIGRLGVRHVVVGYDFSYGKDRGGSTGTLQAAGAAAGFGVTVIDQQAEDGEAFSSTAIRLHLSEGNVNAAARALGHWWRVSGVVAHGAKIGTELGFPTANIDLAVGTALKHGIYAVRVHHAGRTFGGAAYFGTRPTVDDGPPRLEAFLFDFSGDLYGSVVGVELIGFVRGDRRFRSLDEMKAQIARDCEAAAVLLAAAPITP